MKAIDIKQRDFYEERLNIKDKVLLINSENIELNKEKYEIRNLSQDDFLNYSNKDKVKEIGISLINPPLSIENLRGWINKSYDLLMVNGIIILKCLNPDCLSSNKDKIKFPLWKEDIESILKTIGFYDIECYGNEYKEELREDGEYIILRARKYLELLKDTPEYEVYGDNYIKSGCKCSGNCHKKSCSGGCCRKKG